MDFVNFETEPQVNQTNKVIKSINNLPLYFVENRGQLNEHVKYHLKIPNGNVCFTAEEIVYQFLHRGAKGKNREERLMRKEKEKGEEIKVENIRVRYVGMNEKVKVEGMDESQAKYSYFRGKNPQKWVKGARAFNKLIYRELYPNIDLIVYGNGMRIKNEYRIRVGGKVEKIKLRYEGIKQLRVNERGQLEIETEQGILKEDIPLSYQIIEGKKVEVETKYVIENDNTLGFKVGEFKKDRELIIDPDLIYSTYLGGAGNENQAYQGIAIDESENVYITGWTDSSDFPIALGAYDTTHNGNDDVFVTKLNSTGTELLYSIYLGGITYDYPTGVAVDATGNAYVTGSTVSPDFPTTPGAYDTTYNARDAFITKINSTGTDLVYSTYLGGTDVDYAEGIAVDGSGNAYVTGYAASSDFPTTPGAYDTTFNGGYSDVFITKLNSTGTDLLYSTFLGGSDIGSDRGFAIAVDESGNAYIMGSTPSSDFPTTPDAYDTTHNGLVGSQDVFITKLNSTGTDLLYSTFLGGWGLDSGRGIAIDASGNAYVTGFHMSSDFPTTPGAYDTTRGGNVDAFVTKINSTGSSLLYSTYLGGSNYDYGFAIEVDESGNAYITGHTWNYSGYSDNDFPTTAGAYDASYNVSQDAFLTKINSTGTELIYSTYLGGTLQDSGTGIAIDTNGNAYVMGHAESSDFPTTPGAYDTSYNGESDIFVTKIPISVGLTISATAGGTTDPEPGSYIYDEGTEVIITATLESGYEFSNWSGDASGTDNPKTITMDWDKSVTANFTSISNGDGDGDGKKGGCFIATAAYGFPLHPHLDILRDFRDRYLMPNKPGRVLVNFYYKYSPFVAELIAKNKVLKVAVQINLLPFVAFSYSMVHLGPIITTVLIAVIFILPVFLILFLRRKQPRLSINC